MKKNMNKTETMKFNPEAIGQTNIRMRWKMDFFLFEENKVQLLEDEP